MTGVCVCFLYFAVSLCIHRPASIGSLPPLGRIGRVNKWRHKKLEYGRATENVGIIYLHNVQGVHTYNMKTEGGVHI